MVRYLAILLMMVIFGCSEKENLEAVYDVPEEFQVFVDSFIAEAAQRGQSITINNLIIHYDEALTDPHCGECNSASLNKNIQKIISVNPHLVCWVSDQEKEAFFFHELGHCVLGRQHESALLPNGSPKSIMIPSNLLLYEPCQYPIDGTNSCNHIYRRMYYVDELFDPATGVPDWGM